MQQARAQNNATSFFAISQIPSDNQIRQMLDPVPPQTLYPVYDRVYDTLREQGILATFRAVHDSTLIALDGTWYHASKKIHCHPIRQKIRPFSFDFRRNSVVHFKM